MIATYGVPETRSKRARGEASRQRILDAAAQIVGERGYEGTTTGSLGVLTGRSEFTKHPERMDRATAIFVDGLGAAAATSGVLTQLQGRIFALLYLRDGPLALEEIAAELEQSKSNVSVNIRGLVDWHLVRRTRVPGSRKDHYEAATDFWRVMQEIMERRFRWNVRQVLAAAGEAARAANEKTDGRRPFVTARLGALSAFFTAIDAGVGAFTQGKPLDPEALRNVLPLTAARAHQRR